MPPRRFARLNLRKAEVKSAQSAHLLRVSDDARSLFEEFKERYADNLPDNETIGFAIDYSIMKSLVRLNVVILVTDFPESLDLADAGGDAALVSILYRVRSSEKRIKPIGLPESTVIDFLERIQGDLRSSSAIVKYELQGVSSSDIWFPLPTNLSGGDAGTVLFELSGIKGTRLNTDTSDNTQYQFEMESTEPGTVEIEIHGQAPGPGPEMMRTVLEEFRGWLGELTPGRER